MKLLRNYQTLGKTEEASSFRPFVIDLAKTWASGLPDGTDPGAGAQALEFLSAEAPDIYRWAYDAQAIRAISFHGVPLPWAEPWNKRFLDNLLTTAYETLSQNAQQLRRQAAWEQLYARGMELTAARQAQANVEGDQKAVEGLGGGETESRLRALIDKTLANGYNIARLDLRPEVVREVPKRFWEEVAEAKGGSIALIESIYNEQFDEDPDREHRRIDAVIVPERDLDRLPLTLTHETSITWVYHHFSRGDVYDGQEWFRLEDHLEGTSLRRSWPTLKLVREAGEQPT